MAIYYTNEGKTVEADSKPDGCFNSLDEYNNEFNRLKKNLETWLKIRFKLSQESSHLISSLGFEVNADETANRNIDGLIKLLTADSTITSVQFCAYDNTFHGVTLDNLKTLQKELILFGNQLYAKKWTYRMGISSATTLKDLQAIDIAF